MSILKLFSSPFMVEFASRFETFPLLLIEPINISSLSFVELSSIQLPFDLDVLYTGDFLS